MADIGTILRVLDGPGMFLMALLDSSFLSLPEGNDLLIVGLSIGKAWSRVAYYVGMTAAGSITGCMLLYAIGRRGGCGFMRRRISAAKMERMQNLFRKYGLLAVAIPAILPPPFPFRIFVLSAGVFGIRLPQFFTAVAFGRLVRYSTWGVLAFHYGEAVKRYMQANLPALGIALLSAVAVAIIGALATFYFRRRLRPPATTSL